MFLTAFILLLRWINYLINVFLSGDHFDSDEGFASPCSVLASMVVTLCKTFYFVFFCIFLVFVFSIPFWSLSGIVLESSPWSINFARLYSTRLYLFCCTCFMYVLGSLNNVFPLLYYFYVVFFVCCIFLDSVFLKL